MKIAVICVGNKLMLDDGLGPVVYEELTRSYDFPDDVQIFDVGCLSMDMLGFVDSFDMMISVDAIDGTGKAPGTVFSYGPDDIAKKTQASASLHDLTLADLFDAALLLGYGCKGKCFGMQVSNPSPGIATIGLTQKVLEAVPLLVEALLSYLVSLGVEIRFKGTGEAIAHGWKHIMHEPA